MTRLTWGANANRYYENGLDRGVLYPLNGTGVPWNGLISISSTGGQELASYYLDGKVFAVLPTRGEPGGTIEAYTYPPEFAQCDGSYVMAAGGFYANHQRPRPFSLCYRTTVGNAAANTYYRYHLLYNATAIPSDKTYGSTGENAEALVFSWEYRTVPVTIAGARPTSSYTIDTRYCSGAAIDQFEAIVYGTDDDEPRLPTTTELLGIFT